MVESLLLIITTQMLVVLIYSGQRITRGVAVAFRAGKATINAPGQGGRQLRQLAGTVAREYCMAMPLDFPGFSLRKILPPARGIAASASAYITIFDSRRFVRSVRRNTCRCHTAHNQRFNNHFRRLFIVMHLFCKTKRRIGGRAELVRRLHLHNRLNSS